MYTGQAAVFSNREDWPFPPYSIVDDDTGDLVDLSLATIEMAITYQDGCRVLTGNLNDGTVILVESDTFQIIVTRGRITNLCAGTYEIGVTVTNAAQTISLIVGTIAVIEGRVTA